MTIAWVLGSSGLLGSALCRALRNSGTELFFPVERVRWDLRAELPSQITRAVHAFSDQAGTTARWEIYWAAGVGTMSSLEDALVPETAAISHLLQALKSDSCLMAAHGAIAFASSAGAIYAGASDEMITENTAPAPTTAYAREKLKQEELVRLFTLANSQLAALVARVSTLYGPGQATGKQQGLLAHIARSIVRNQPVQIYVPYDTIRDYIAADDAATAIVTALRTTSEKPQVTTKIIAAERPTTIAEIVSIFGRLARRSPRIVTSASRLSSLYSRRVQFRSIVLPGCAKPPTKSMFVGIADLLMAERAAFVRGRVT